ncbi:MAG: GWxTD domain-containing protein [Bacteroidota bacterium]
MKKLLLFCLILSAAGAQAQFIQAFLAYSTFNAPEQGPYIETYVTIDANSIVFVKKDNGKFQGTIETTFIFKQNGIVKDFRKYNVLSPEVDDTSKTAFAFIDQQRIPLPQGKYDFEISIADKNTKADPFKTTEILNIDFPADKASFSGIELVESYKKSTENTTQFSKSGYDLYPYTYDYFPQKVNRITFYSELYNTEKIVGKDQPFMLNTFIQVAETKQKLNDFSRSKKYTSAPVTVIMSEFQIEALPSENYNLVVEARNKSNEVITTNSFYFQRNNPGVAVSVYDISAIDIGQSFVGNFKNADSLYEHIQSMWPLGTEQERNVIDNIKNDNVKFMQQFFHRFWTLRSPNAPQKAWSEYYTQVQKVNKTYSTKIKKGYATDRGRVYLQYGPPNTINSQPNEPSAYPYEIWHYYSLENQSNRKFVFYNTDLSSNEYALLHSDAKGEVYEPRWENILHGRNQPFKIDGNNNPQDQYGSRSNTFFKNPY